MNQATPAEDNTALALHELIDRIVAEEPPLSRRKLDPLPVSGTLQGLNQRLERRPVADFFNYTLRGVGQVIFANNPISGVLVLLALLIQSPWGCLLSLVGVLTSTVTALLLRCDRTSLRNGFFGYNGLPVGAALALFSDPDAGAGRWAWVVATILFSALTAVLMQTLGGWMAKTWKVPSLSVPFNIATLSCLALVQWVPQPWLALKTASAVEATSGLDWLELAASLPRGFGQVVLADGLVPGVLVVLAVALCSPLGALVGLLGGVLGLLAGISLGLASPEALYAGLWGYNAALTLMSLGGIFYAPTTRSLLIGAIAAFLSAALAGALGPGFSLLGLPVLTVPFCLITIGACILLQRSLPSLVPVALHALASPEEHYQRYRAAKFVIRNFRHQLAVALANRRRYYLFDRASQKTKGDLRYLFNLIDTDFSNTISTQELSAHLRQAGQVVSEAELAYLFSRMDSDGNGSIDFAEFGELMLRHRRLMANYQDFVAYFIPIDANGDDAISLAEMNVALASVGEVCFSPEEEAYLAEQMDNQPLTWNRFVEMLLIS